MNDKERFLIFQKANYLKIDKERIIEIEKFLGPNENAALFRVTNLDNTNSILISGEIVEEIKKYLKEDKQKSLERMKDILNFSSEEK